MWAKTPKSQSVYLSHARSTLGCPTPNSPACSPRRQRGQVFRALFPACDGSLRIMRPSYPGLRLGNNGDRMTRGRREIGIGELGPRNSLNGSDTLPPRGWQTGATPSGNNSRGLAPRSGRETRESKKTPYQNRNAPSCASTWLTQERSSMGPHSGLRGTLHPAQERFVRFLVYGERAVLIGKSKRENVL